MDTHSTGPLLYMVLRRPFECEHCHSLIRDWEQEEDGKVHCPECDNIVEEFTPVRCGACGEEDLLSLVVASNNNFHASYDEIVPYEDRLNMVQSFCEKSIMNDISSGRIKKLSPQEARRAKEMIVWTHFDDYEPGKPVPEKIKEMFK